jgi:hypothetical protein
MILRIWHGWTSLSNADAYETLLKEEIFVGIGNRRIEGYRAARVKHFETPGMGLY